MILEETVSIGMFETTVKFSYVKKEPCRPNKFDPGSPEEFEIHEVSLILEPEIIDLIINALKQKQIFNEAA